MRQPFLRIIAGCNGAGKSTYSQSYISEGDQVVPFDYDKRYHEIYNSMFDSDMRDTMAKNQTNDEFVKAIEVAFQNRQSFCYETNFDQQPLLWVKKAQKLGYCLELVFFCLRSIQMAKDRVKFRVQIEKGHFVTNKAVDFKWKEGYKNLNNYFADFDKVLLVENSSSVEPPKNLCLLYKLASNNYFEVKKYTPTLPTWTKRRIPAIYEIWNTQ